MLWAVMVQERAEVRVVVAVRSVGDEGAGLQHRFEAGTGSVGAVPDFRQLGEVTGDLARVPGVQDRFDVREVLVRRGPPDTDLLRNLRHRHWQRALLGRQGGGAVQDGVAHVPAVRLDRLVPQLRHAEGVRGADRAAL
ncbi:hypothetical protein GCM10019016_029930 [Streptomyces prasinosporus]|uniref:Uncharacterized protein n=1 Tax=Streptomyces prasinosporus TaxID=68256 RepID=A0ABP6TKY1_9ACTN